MTENLTHGHSSVSAQRELFNEYQMTGFRWFSNLGVLVPWTKVALALEGLSLLDSRVVIYTFMLHKTTCI